jgi:hypothetical protein
MDATELTIDVVYKSPYWVVQFEKIINNRRLLALKRIGKNEPGQSELAKFFQSLNYKKLKYMAA